jgi:hypothetical protein
VAIDDPRTVVGDLHARDRALAAEQAEAFVQLVDIGSYAFRLLQLMLALGQF